jgi:hypothetical protein
MTERVVDLLEAVEIDEHHAPVSPSAWRHCLLDAVLEQHSSGSVS